ncbi:hypothetical protein D3C80_2055230 [compost metagenome]
MGSSKNTTPESIVFKARVTARNGMELSSCVGGVSSTTAQRNTGRKPGQSSPITVDNRSANAGSSVSARRSARLASSSRIASALSPN